MTREFRTPKKSLGNLDAEATASLIAAAADIALIIDEQGTIRDVAFHTDDLAGDLEDGGDWLGRAWRDTVTVESRPKVEALLAAADGSSAVPMRPRHVNHPSPAGADVPILYSAVRIGARGRLVAFGRDLRAVSALQQRLVDAQQSMERDYARLRDVERRYNLLFQTVDPVLVLDAASLGVVEANAAASQLFDASGGGAALRGRTVATLFDAPSAGALQRVLAGVRATGRAEDATATLPGGRVVRASASVFREDQAWLFLLRLSLAANDSDPPAVETLNTAASRLLDLARHAPDAFVVVGPDLRVVTLNAAFLEMAQVPTEADVVGQPVERWVGRPGVDLDVLVANLRQRGSVRLFSTIVVGEHGQRTQVEISAVAMINAGAPGFGFAIRDVGRRVVPATVERAEPRTGETVARKLPRSVEQLTELIGRVSLKEMVRESTDVIERLCIEAALELTGDNRASAAEMLGLSRQSFYVKLRRYGLGDLGTDAADDDA